MADLRSAARERRATTLSNDRSGLQTRPNNADPLTTCLLDGLNSLPSGFALFDKDDNAVMINAELTAMLPNTVALMTAGTTFPEVARQIALTLFELGEESIDAWLERRLAYRQSPSGTFDQKLTDGRWIRILENRTSDGGTVTNWTDITDLKSQEEAINAYASALANTNSELQEFAHVASHDLQEPLRKIEAFGSRLADSCADKLNERESLYLERMQDAAARMRTLVGDLLDYSQVRDSQDGFAPVELNTVLIQTLENLELTIEERTARITFGDLPAINGDDGQLVRLFQNLLSNSLKYCLEDRAPEIHIEATTPHDGFVTVTVTDNGIGFEPEYAEKIFNIFQRLHNRSQYKGTGIGLASCRKIAQAHGGKIHAVGRPGDGSTFSVALPIVV